MQSQRSIHVSIESCCSCELTLTNKSKTTSFSTAGSSITTESFGGTRFFKSLSATKSKPNAMNPKHRIAQPKPIRSMSLLSIIGMTIPPVAEPDSTILMARLRRVASKYVETTETIGTNKQPFASPMQTPCASTNCQYFVQILVVNIPMSQSTIPVRMTSLKCPKSDAAPDHNGNDRRKKTVNAPIQEIFEGEESPMVV